MGKIEEYKAIQDELFETFVKKTMIMVILI